MPYAVSAVVDAGPIMIVPLRGSGRVHGVLNLVRLRGRAAFSAEDLDLATGFANQAAVALELAQARADQQRAALFDERERIAADLHDHVIQRLFAAGLSLQALAATLGPGRATNRVMSTVSDLDATISQIRTAIFQLQQTSQTSPRTLRARVLDLVGELAPALGFDPAVRFSGLLDILPDQPRRRSARRRARGAEQHRPARPRAHRGDRPHRPRRPGHAHRPGRRRRRQRHHAPQRPGQHAPPRRAARRRLRARTRPRQRHPAHLDRAPGLLTLARPGRRSGRLGDPEVRERQLQLVDLENLAVQACSRTPAASVRVVRIAW